MSDLPATLVTVVKCDHRDPEPPARGFFVQGASMPLLMTVAEVDAALKRAQAIPEGERGELWQLIVDELLERRVALATVDANMRTIRVLRAAETR